VGQDEGARRVHVHQEQAVDDARHHPRNRESPQAQDTISNDKNGRHLKGSFWQLKQNCAFLIGK